ncbi:hypothetical protein AB9P05_06535 [Roseivirga sp. BDSF3-8]|uniref:hypothetical protein n=1 Tax=Roseivirga sp. BDSF3-8 TaxID=3241598 RepID=UPI003531BDDB
MSKPLVLYVQVAPPAKVCYGHPFAGCEEKADIFEFDNHSGEPMAGYATRLVQQASSLFVWVEAAGSEQEALGVVRPVLSGLLAVKKDKMMYIRGHHPMLERMSGPLGANVPPEGVEPATLLKKWLSPSDR